MWALEKSPWMSQLVQTMPECALAATSHGNIPRVHMNERTLLNNDMYDGLNLHIIL